MGESLMSILDFFVAWPSVLNKISAIAEDERQLDSFVEERLMELIRQEHPDDYEAFITEHADDLATMRKRISDKYREKLKRYVKAVREHGKEGML
jgi:hypothetical protein